MRCGTCGRELAPRRRDQRWCSAGCRSRGHARARAEGLARHLAALDALQAGAGAAIAHDTARAHPPALAPGMRRPPGWPA